MRLRREDSHTPGQGPHPGLLREFKGPGGGVLSVVVTPDSRHAVTGSMDMSARLWARPDGSGAPAAPALATVSMSWPVLALLPLATPSARPASSSA